MGVTEKAVLYSRSRFSCELSEIGAAKPDGARLLREAQPPSGGCVLKRLSGRGRRWWRKAAAFRRLCVETPASFAAWRAGLQPPSGGCVLKQTNLGHHGCRTGPAAFGRLCVETVFTVFFWGVVCQPPSGGCVLKLERYFLLI